MAADQDVRNCNSWFEVSPLKIAKRCKICGDFESKV